jgi:hypothetical protein
MWFKLTADERIFNKCASEDCSQQPTFRQEHDGVGADYCGACKEKIDPHKKETKAPAQQ